MLDPEGGCPEAVSKLPGNVADGDFSKAGRAGGLFKNSTIAVGYLIRDLKSRLQ
jgi:hypothetical protein